MSDLSSAHQTEVKNFLRFFADKSSEHQMEVQAHFSDITEEKVTEDQYSRAEVEGLLDTLQENMEETIKTESRKNARQLALYLRQLFIDAQGKNAALKIQTNTLDDALLLSNMEALNLEVKVSPVKAQRQKPNLVALDASTDTSLVSKMKKLQQENMALKMRFEKLQAQMQATQSINSKERERKAKLTSDVKSAQAEVATLSAGQSASYAAVHKKLSTTRSQLSTYDAKLLKISSELDGRITQSAQYRNYQKMLGSKSVMIKQLKAQLAAKS